MHYILFVDSENLPASSVTSIQQAFSERGDTYDARVYGCKTAMGLPWKKAIADAKWSLVNVKRTYGDGQALDMAMILDMVDTFHLNRQYGIAVASGDSDFLPALMRIHGHGGQVLILTDPEETAKKVKDALPHAIVPIHKPHSGNAAKKKALLDKLRHAEQRTRLVNPHTKRTIITVSSARDEAIRRICKQAFNEYVVNTRQPEMPLSKLITAFQKENHWFKTKSLGFKNMRELAMSLGVFTICRKIGPTQHPLNEWFLRRKDVNYELYENDTPPVEDVVFKQ